MHKSFLSDKLWSQYVFDMAEAFCSQNNHTKKTLWAGNQILLSGWCIQLNAEGQLIHEEDFEYFWLVHNETQSST